MDRASSFLLSLSLHALIVFMILFWPAPTLLDLDNEVYQVSLVVGDMGGEGLASAVLGARPNEVQDAPDDTSLPSLPDAEQLIPDEPIEQAIAPLEDIDAVEVLNPELEELPERESIVPEPELLPEPKPEPQPEPEPEPIPEPEPEPEPIPEPEPTPEPEPEPEPQPAPEPEPEPAPEPSTSSTGGSSSNSGAASSALAALQSLVDSSSPGGVGGGGGTGSGPGGGGIYDVYMAQVMLVVQSAWSMPIYSREQLSAQVAVELDANGKILDTRIARSSGRADFDASAMNTLIRLGALPAPPNADLTSIVINFNSGQ